MHVRLCSFEPSAALYPLCSVLHVGTTRSTRCRCDSVKGKHLCHEGQIYVTAGDSHHKSTKLHMLRLKYTRYTEGVGTGLKTKPGLAQGMFNVATV